MITTNLCGQSITRDQLPLSPEVIDFLDTLDTITVGNEVDWYPFDYNKEGRPSGTSVELMKKIGALLDIEIRWVADPSWDSLLTSLDAGRIDLLLNTNIQRAKNGEFLLTKSYMQEPLGLLFRGGGRPMVSSLNGQRVGYVRGYTAPKSFLKGIPQAEVIIVDSIQEGVSGVANNQLDYFVEGQTILEYLARNFKDLQIQPLSNQLSQEALQLGFGVRRDWPLLVEAINTALAFLTVEDINSIIQEYDQDYTTYLNIQRALSFDQAFTREEVDWMLRKQPISVFFLDGLAPVSYFNGEGVPAGVASGYLQLLQDRFGLNIEIKNDKGSLTEAFRDLQRGEVALIPSLSYSESREDFLYFTDSYMNLPLVMYGRKSESFSGHQLRNLNGARIAAIESHIIIDWLKRDYPDLNIVQVKSVEEGLKLTNSGKVDVYIGDFYITTRALVANHFDDIIPTGNTPYVYPISMGVSKQYPLVFSILQKAVQQIRDQYQQEFANTWVGRDIRRRINPLVYQYVFIFVTVFIILLVLQSHYYHREKNLLKGLALKDPLTGLYNRRYLDAVYQTELSRAVRNHRILVFILYDVDNFKKYNDTYGHVKGDEALVSIAQVLKGCFQRGTDHVFRMGGEEFAVLVSVKSTSDAYRLAEKVLDSIRKRQIPHIKNSPTRIVTMSGGLVCLENDETKDFEQLYQAADQSLYKAKQEGRNRLVFTS